MKAPLPTPPGLAPIRKGQPSRLLGQSLSSGLRCERSSRAWVPLPARVLVGLRLPQAGWGKGPRKLPDTGREQNLQGGTGGPARPKGQ